MFQIPNRRTTTMHVSIQTYCGKDNFLFWFQQTSKQRYFLNVTRNHIHFHIHKIMTQKLEPVIKAVLKHLSVELLITFFTCINIPQSFSLLLDHNSPPHAHSLFFPSFSLPLSSRKLLLLAVNYRGYATADTTLKALHNSILIKKTTTAEQQHLRTNQPVRIEYNRASWRRTECNIRGNSLNEVAVRSSYKNIIVVLGLLQS